MTRDPLEVDGSTLPFHYYRQDGLACIEFDSTGCHCPVPMVNAMAGLARALELEARLVMINGFEPEGLYERIQGHFTWQAEALDEERVRVIFSPVPGKAAALDFSQRHCHGGA